MNLHLSLEGKKILLIISGGIAAYKSLDLIRRLRERGAHITPLMTKGAQEFITPLSVGALAASKVHSDLFDRDDEIDVGHIRLARGCDGIIIAPCTADLAAKMANGLADDLASTVLLATDKPILIAPAMNPAMWTHPATQRNMVTLRSDGIHFIGPMSGEMAESGEAGKGRMAEPLEIVAAIEDLLAPKPKPLDGKRIIVTAGPTHEPIDPVRYIANRSSGKQGYAIAGALAELGAEVLLVSGPTNLAPPQLVSHIQVETALQMQKAVETALPADAAFFVAAVADWRAASSADEKIKKDKSSKTPPPPLVLAENPDILAGIGNSTANRPSLVVGFAAETQNVEANASAKLKSKGADWIVANNVSVSDDGSGVMGGDMNSVHLLSSTGVETWPEMSKQAVADKLASRVVTFFEQLEC